jgi:hypothetical protein
LDGGRSGFLSEDGGGGKYKKYEQNNKLFHCGISFEVDFDEGIITGEGKCGNRKLGSRK